VGTDGHSASIDQRSPGLLGAGPWTGRSGALACSCSNAAAFLLGTLFLTASKERVVRKISDLHSFSLCFFETYHYMLCAVIASNPIYAHKVAGTKWLCIVEFEDSYDGSLMAGIGETFES
jgi:hypothetical protein